METSISAPWPLSSASSEKCSKLSKNVRRLQKENSYLRKRKRAKRTNEKCEHFFPTSSSNKYLWHGFETIINVISFTFLILYSGRLFISV